MTPKDSLDVEWCRTETFGDCWNLRCSHKEEHGFGIDKASDEPGTRDAIYLWAFARHPHRAAITVPLRDWLCAGEELAAFAPCFEAASEIHSLDALIA